LSVDGVIQDGVEKFIGVSSFEMSSEPAMLEVATFIPAWFEEKKKKRCIEVARKIYRSFGFDNCGFHCEMKWSLKRGPILIEIAARLPGGQMLDGYRQAYGVDLAEMCFDIAVGKKVKKYIERKNINLVLQESIPLEKEGKIAKVLGAGKLDLSNVEIYQICQKGEMVENHGGIFYPKIYYSVMSKTKNEINRIRKIAKEIKVEYDILFYFLDKAKRIVKGIKGKFVG